MRSKQEIKKVWSEIKIDNVHGVKSHHMEENIGILLYNSFISLPGSNQTFEEKQGYFKPVFFKLGVATPRWVARKDSMGVAECFENSIKVLTRIHFKQMRKTHPDLTKLNVTP